jgi:hypothetical protein
MYNNIKGSNNIAQGLRALCGNISGCDNVAQGNLALSQNTIGSCNVAIGSGALNSNKISGNNIGIGFQALYSNTGGTDNISMGYGTLYNNKSGCNNIAMGQYVLRQTTTGSNNTAQGCYAMYGNTSGNNNIAQGYQALYGNTSGSNNVAIGQCSGFQSTGSENVYLGAFSGSGNTASNRLYIANSKACTLIYGNFTGNTVTIGGNMCATGCGFAIDFIASSDRRLKTNITPISNALSMVMELQGVCYQMCDDCRCESRIGLIAQDVEKVLPEVVSHEIPTNADTKFGINDEKLGLKYDKMVAVLIEAIKEQQIQINNLSTELNNIKLNRI